MNKKLILNALGFNAVWFAWALGVPTTSLWLAVILPTFISVAFITLHLRASLLRRADVRLIALSVLAGFAFDSTLQLLGWVQFVAPNPEPISKVQPWWMAAMWAAFACTLNHSMAWLRRVHWFLAGILCGILGYFSYVGAAKLGALQVSFGYAPVLALLCFWAVFVPAAQRLKK